MQHTQGCVCSEQHKARFMGRALLVEYHTMVMTVRKQDGWVNIPPFDEFSVNHSANSADGRRHRLLYVEEKSPRFAEGEHPQGHRGQD